MVISKLRLALLISLASLLLVVLIFLLRPSIPARGGATLLATHASLRTPLRSSSSPAPLAPSFSPAGMRCESPDGGGHISLKLSEIARARWKSTDFHADGIREEYVHQGNGIEQIVHLPTPPQGTGDLILTTRVDTSLAYVGEGAGGRLLFRRPGSYEFAAIAGAVACDAKGRTLPLAMHFRSESSAYTVRVPAGWLDQASYPVAIDPTLTWLDLLNDPVIGPWIGVVPDRDIEMLTGIRLTYPQDPLLPATGGSIILTVAGGGGVADGPALDAGLNFPSDVALDGSANLFIADTLNHRIRVHNRGGNATFNGVFIKSGDVGTIAGTGTAGFAGDGGPATSALLNAPEYIAVDAAGNVYFTERTYRIRKIDTAGVITTVIGTGVSGYSGDGGPAAGAQIGYILFGMIARGNLLIFADSYNHRVRAVNVGTASETILGKTVAVGNVDTILGNGVAANTGDGTSALFPTGAPGEPSLISVNWPWSLALDAASNLYVVTFESVVASVVTHRIRVVNLSTSPALVFGGTSVTTVPLNQIATVIGGGTDAFSSGIDRSLVMTDVSGFDFDSSGRMFWGDGYTVAPFLATRMRRLDNVTGVVTTISGGLQSGFGGDGGPASAAVWGRIQGLAIHQASSEVFAADIWNNKIRKIAGGDPTSIVSSVIGSGYAGASGNDALSYTASLGRPNSVRYRLEGAPPEPRFFVADLGNHRVFQVEANGRLTTLAGKGIAGMAGDGGPAVDALLFSPRDASFDPAGNLYVVDGRNSAIRVINRQGTPLQVGSVTVAPGNIDTVAGVLGTSGFNGEGGPQLSVQLRIPSAVDVSFTTPAVYILDRSNQRLRVLNRNAVPGASITVLGVTIAAGEIKTVIPGPVVGNIFFFPWGMRLDPVTEDIVVADQYHNRVVRITQGGAVLTEATLSLPEGVAIGLGGELFVTSRANDRIYRISGGVLTPYSGDGLERFAGDGASAAGASYFNPSGMDVEVLDAMAGTYRLYVADEGNNRIRRIQPEEAEGGFLPAGTYNPIPGVTITTSQPATSAGAGWFSVTASSTGPPPPPDFKIGAGSKSIYFTIDAMNLTFLPGNDFTITIYWDDEFQCSGNNVKLFRYSGGTWGSISNPPTGGTDCATHTTTGVTSGLSIFKVFEAIALPLGVAVEPEKISANPGTYTITVTPGGSYALNDIATSTLRVNGAAPERVVVSANKVLLKAPRNTIADLGNGTGAVSVTGELSDGRLVQGEAIVPVK